MTTVAVAGPGLYEVTLEVDDATPGSGIALLDAKGEPLDGIEFARELKTKLAFGYGTPREPPSLSDFDFTNSCVPLAGPRQWLRLGPDRWIVEMLDQRRRRALGRCASTAHRPLRPGKASRYMPAKQTAIARIRTMSPATSACEACRSASSAG